MLQNNYYEILNISHDATKDEIEKAYQDLAIGFQEVKEAYEVLRDPEKRSQYDLTQRFKGPIPYTIRGNDGADMVLIPAGNFEMGSDDEDASDDEKPVHTVYLDAFYIDRYLVTNAQYKMFIDENPEWQKANISEKYHDSRYLKHWNGNDYPESVARHPVVHVSWYAAIAYAKWADKRLPTDAEWEKAARGGLIGKRYPCGDSIDSNQANYGGVVGDITSVGSYPPNGYGLYDMAGNVFEWCLDEYKQSFYAKSPRKNPVAGGSLQSILKNFLIVKKFDMTRRGDSWHVKSREAALRVANKDYWKPTGSASTMGFRCVRVVMP